MPAESLSEVPDKYSDMTLEQLASIAQSRNIVVSYGGREGVLKAHLGNRKDNIKVLVGARYEFWPESDTKLERVEGFRKGD